PYSDETFANAAINWAYMTNQPLRVFQHPKFKRIIELASRAKNGIKIPSEKATRKQIIDCWYQHLRWLRKHLNVRP
ncbi:uncharacterized protein STEHIDRAFT_48545, partial [Stereum hirsutum FP-91666 SS1]|uniref:uncharacterized protein n=1 Tax=Stereum hirsutum (strain FP-91666) TaxID=721885 RepID=UPI00044105B6